MVVILSNASSTSKYLLLVITDKLDRNNFGTWCETAIITVSSQSLEGHFKRENVPQQFVESGDATKPGKIESETYKEWKLQDLSLMTWLLASITPTIKSKLKAQQKQLKTPQEIRIRILIEEEEEAEEEDPIEEADTTTTPPDSSVNYVIALDMELGIATSDLINKLSLLILILLNNINHQHHLHPFINQELI
ncbi:hypothetical protein PIB30_053133 [Stylosanthes scabra]|uniref:Retrotransposon Copia-like N-terminal domain-containing protein n=1 Tax=Stylosanthes scabra TaxID=79078 RepID=A0ABU6YFV4_9FABA|nr:hypothetical protein [Stylosanthes scabra]